MPSTITWSIVSLDRRISDGYVTTAHWRCEAVDGDYTASVYSTCNWSYGQPTVPYEGLTPETVLDWVWTSGVDKEDIESFLDGRIEAQKNPVYASGTPWSVQE